MANYFSRKAIKFYKRFLSGTLFKSKVCSFPEYTCSSYGYDMFERHNWREARKKTFSRMRRCSGFKIFKIGETFGWGFGFDRFVQDPNYDIERVVDRLYELEEDKSVVGNVLNSMYLIHEKQHGECSSELARIIDREGVANHLPYIRNASRYKRQFAAKALKWGAITTTAAVAFTAIPYVPLITAPVLAGMMGVWHYWRYDDRIAPFERFISANSQ